jgi:hypothetical protein
MKSIKQVTNTALVTLHLFPVLFSDDADARLLPFLAFFGMLFSLPALLLCWLLFAGVMKLKVNGSAKQCAWVLAVVISTITGAMFISLLFDV